MPQDSNVVLANAIKAQTQQMAQLQRILVAVNTNLVEIGKLLKEKQTNATE